MSDSHWLAGGSSGVRGEVNYVATPLFLVHLLVLEIYGGCDGEMRVGRRKGFLKMLQGFRQEILNGCEGGDDGWRAEAVGDE